MTGELHRADRSCMTHGRGRIMPAQHQVILQRRHAVASVLDALRKFRCEFGVPWEKTPEKPRGLVAGRILEPELDIGAAGADQRRIEPIEVVGGHHDQPAFRGGDAVDRFEQAREPQSAHPSIGPLPFDEGTVDVLQKDDAALGHPDEQVVDGVVVDVRVAQDHQENAHAQLAGQRLTTLVLPLPGGSQRR
jgi:hypothetical protein